MLTKRSPVAPPKNLTIKFDGPYPTCTDTKDVLAECRHRKAAGIFLMATLVGDSYRITHLGQTGTSFYARLKEHVIQTLGGNYRIVDPQALSRGETKVLWNGLWRPGTHQKLPEFLRDSTRYIEAAKTCFRIEMVFVAPLDLEERMRKRIEGAIAKTIRKDPVASSLFPPDVRSLGRLTTEAPATVRIVAPARILGLPEQLEI
jgi:hypothetical protein